jgi:hypothetical protein
MTEARRYLQLAALQVLGLAIGVWVFVSPWVLAYPDASKSWSHSTWTCIWTGGILIAVSGGGLISSVALGARAAIRRARPELS